MTKLQQDHLMILLESMDSKLQISLECFASLNCKIDSVRDELKEDIAVLDCKIIGLSERVDAVETKLSSKIDEVDKRLSSKIDEVDKKLSSKIDEVDKRLSSKIDEVDKKLSSKIDDVHSELLAHRNDTELHRNRTKRTLKSVKL